MYIVLEGEQTFRPVDWLGLRVLIQLFIVDLFKYMSLTKLHSCTYTTVGCVIEYIKPDLIFAMKKMCATR